MSTSASTSYNVSATQSFPDWAKILIVIAGLAVLVLVLRRILRGRSSSQRRLLPSHTFEMSESSLSEPLVHPPPAYFPSPSPPPYPGPELHRPRTAQSSSAVSRASSSLHNSFSSPNWIPARRTPFMEWSFQRLPPHRS
ncbi:hypothetical protein EDD16DRAFT_1700552 [Pisolithus croceorrhizus]|nr:hypothetical protein EDD16DRAFT_1700552 [Pisolithus croceorrhizus]